MKKRALKVLIIGAGFMGDCHAKAYLNIGNIKIAGIVEKNHSKALQFSESYQCRNFDNMEAAMDEDLDFVDVCLPTVFHKDAVMHSFKAGKDVICEKPIALSMNEAAEMVEAADTSGRKFMLAHVVRFWPEYKRFSEMLLAGEIMDIKTATFSRYQAVPKWSDGNWLASNAKSGGVIFDLAIHDIDFVISIFGMPDWVFARQTLLDEDFTAYLNAILGYEDKNVLIEAGSVMSATYPFTSGFRISNGEVSLEYVNKSGKGLVIYTPDTAAIKAEYQDSNPYEQELSYFADCIREDKKPVICTGKDALKALWLAECIKESCVKKQRVEVV